MGAQSFVTLRHHEMSVARHGMQLAQRGLTLAPGTDLEVGRIGHGEFPNRLTEGATKIINFKAIVIRNKAPV
ncbi:hypothetical protein CVN68_19790 [Sphingomonas psychrotolerans]|uniref:Uncharacterized protein n=1 Tax=Sphingomonas psychrotolerans TaxID=1327635 RepID=A0A2K8MPM3_9SPHN|nr:hypothetical protein CVN68_19790 [Sphingomonas psychrotolerans]